MIYYAIALLVGILWVHVKLLAICVFILLIFVAIRKHFKWQQYLLLLTIPIVSYFYFQHHYNLAISKQTYIKTHEDFNGSVQFLNQAFIKDNKLQGTVKVNDDLYKYYYFLDNQDLSKVQMFLQHRSCNVKGKIKQNNKDPNSKPFLFINDVDFKSCKATDNAGLLNLLNHHKQYIYEKLKGTQLNKPERIIAHISGDTLKMDEDIIDKFKEIGIYHLLAVSGTHIGIIVGLLYFILNKLKIPLILINTIIVMILPIYAIYTDFAPSAVRAICGAICIVLFKDLIFKNSMNILGCSFIFLSLLNPSLIYNIGFQFSYLITFCILFSSPIFTNTTPIFALIHMTVIAQLGSFIISAIYFNQIQWIGIFANLFFVPFYSLLFFPIIILYFITVHFPFEINILTYFVNILFNFHDFMIELFYLLSRFKWFIPKLSELYVVIAVLLILFMLIIYTYKRYLLFIMMNVALYVLVTILPIPHEYRLTMLDVGQGDALLFETAHHHSILIDTGGKAMRQKGHNSHNIAKYHILPTLKKHGLNQINYLVLTHPHEDHIGELFYLIDHFSIEHIIINPASYNSIQLQHLKHVCDQKHIKLIDYVSLSSFKFDDAQITFCKTTMNQSQDLNEHSITTYIQYKHYKILLMGDATTNNEQQFLQRYNISHIDILKVGHHGSKTSSSEQFINQVEPKVSLISVGKNNIYNLPNNEVLERLQRLHSKIFMTSTEGETTVTLSEELQVEIEAS